MKVKSREYKVIIDGEILAGGASGLGPLLQDIANVGKATGIELKGRFDADDPTRRFIRFLDTRDHTLKSNDLLLRQRIRPKSGKTEYTLKCRSPDYYIAAGKNVGAAKRFKVKDKLEDDINPPFVSKLSHSTTVEPGKRWSGRSYPTTLAEASEIFPGILEVERAGRVCSPKTKLGPVVAPPVFEQVFKGPELTMPGLGKIGPVAVILWTRGEQGRTLIAELSFRHETIKQRRMGNIASLAKRFFEELQRQPWAWLDEIGKTEFMYGLKSPPDGNTDSSSTGRHGGPDDLLPLFL